MNAKYRIIISLFFSLFLFIFFLFTSVKSIDQLEIFCLQGDIGKVYLDVMDTKNDNRKFDFSGDIKGNYTTSCEVFNNAIAVEPDYTVNASSGVAKIYSLKKDFEIRADANNFIADSDGKFVTYASSKQNFFTNSYAQIAPKQAYLIKIHSLLAEGKGLLLLTSPTAKEVILSDNFGGDKFYFDISPLMHVEPVFLFITLGFSIFLGAILYLLLASVVIFEIKNTISQNKVLFVILSLYLLLIYFVFYPAIHLNDNFFISPNALEFNELLGFTYGCYLFFIRAIGLHNEHIIHLVLFFITFYNFIFIMEQRQTPKPPKYIFLFLSVLSPAVLLMIMGEQRFYTAPLLLYASLSFCLRFVFIIPKRSYKCLLASSLLYAMSFALRPDLLIFSLFFLVLLAFNLPSKLSLRGKTTHQLVFFTIPILVIAFIPLTPVEKRLNLSYKLTSQFAMLKPFVSCDNKDNKTIIRILNDFGGYDEYCKMSGHAFFSRKGLSRIDEIYKESPSRLEKYSKYFTAYLLKNLESRPHLYIRYITNNIILLSESIFNSGNRFRSKYHFEKAEHLWPTQASAARFFYYEHYGNLHKKLYDNIHLYFSAVGKIFGFVMLLCIFILFPFLFRKSLTTLIFNLSCILYVIWVAAAAPSTALHYFTIIAAWLSFAYPVACVDHGNLLPKKE